MPGVSRGPPCHPRRNFSTLLIIPAFIGEDSVWRIHMCGGIAWLQSVDAAVRIFIGAPATFRLL